MLRDGKSVREYRAFSTKFVMVIITLFQRFFVPMGLVNTEYINDLKEFIVEGERSNEDYSVDFVLGFLKRLFFQKMNLSFGKDQCVAYVAFVLLCLDENSTSIKVNEVSRRVAKILYFMKISTMALLSKELGKIEEEEIEDIEKLKMKENVENYFMGFYEKTRNNPIVMFFRFAKFVASFGIGEKLPKVYWVLDSNYTCLQAGPTTISIKDLQQGAKKGKNLIESFFTEKMMMNFHYEVPRVISEELNNSSDGFYFIHDKGNNFRGMQERFHSYLISKGLKNDIEGYISHWRRFIQLLIFNIHLTSGNPARSTELETLQFRNTLTKERNIFIFQDKVALIPTYNKTNNIKGQDRLIPRFLPKELSHIVIKYLIFVQPVLEHYFRKISNRLPGEINESSFLFSVNNKQLDGDQIKGDFMKSFREIFLKEIKFSTFRHLVDAFGLRHIAQYKSNFEAYESFSLQAGHTSATASKIYGAISHDFRQVDRETCQRMYETSASWHKFLKIGEVEDKVQPLVEMMEMISVTEGVKNVQEPVANQNNESVQVFQRNVMNLEQSGNDDYSQCCNSNSIDVLRTMRRLLKNNSVSFSCEEQALTAIEVMKREKDVLAIIPTGFGKTMTIFANAKNENLVTVFIYPLIGIKNMMKKKCEEFGISCEEYNSDQSIGQPNIILVSTKNATSENFMTVLGRLSSQNLLARIVIDEVHLSLQWNGFRAE